MSRIGFALGGLDRRPLGELVRLAVAADEHGYELLLVPEAWGRDATVLLGYLAARTRRIAIGTGIINVYSRSPALIAMAVATLDEVSGGRAVLGLGVSGRAVVEGWHGVSMQRPLRRLREVTEAVRKILRRDRGSYDGELVKVAPGFVLRAPVGRDAIPIYHASLTPAGIRQCGEVADGWLPFLVSPATLARDLALLREGLARAGRERSAVTVAPVVPALVTDDVDRARSLLKTQLAFYVGGMGRYYHETLRRRGHAAIADRVRAEWEARRRDAAAEAIPDALLDEFALCGDAPSARTRLDAYRAAGADLPVVYVPEGASGDEAEATLRALAPAL